MAKKKGLWDNIRAKRKRGESPAKKGDKGYPETLDIGEDTVSEIFGWGKKKTKGGSSWGTSNTDATAKARFNNEVKAGNIQKGSTTKFNPKTNSTELVAPKKTEVAAPKKTEVAAPKSTKVAGTKYEAPKAATSPKAKATPKTETKPKSNPYSGSGKLAPQSFSTAVKAGSEMKSPEKEVKPKGKYSDIRKFFKKTKKSLGMSEGMTTARKNVGADTCWDGYKAKGTKKKDGKEVPNCVKEKSFEEFCAEGKSRIETDPDYRKRFKALADNFAEKRKEQAKAKMQKESVEILDVDGNMVAEIIDLIKPEPMTGWRQQVAEAAWTKKAGKSEAGGLNEKGRKSYERENPGSDLKAPSKKVGNKRRSSFCARMKGMRKRQKPENNTGDDRLSKSLRAWNC